MVTPSSMLLAPAFEEWPPLRMAKLQAVCCTKVVTAIETLDAFCGCMMQKGVSCAVRDQ